MKNRQRAGQGHPQQELVAQGAKRVRLEGEQSRPLTCDENMKNGMIFFG